MKLLKLPMNWKQKLFALIGTVMVFFGLWQLDMLMCPYIWADPAVYNSLWTINYELFPTMTRGIAYDLLFAFVVVGFVVSFLALWFWEEKGGE